MQLEGEVIKGTTKFNINISILIKSIVKHSRVNKLTFMYQIYKHKV